MGCSETSTVSMFGPFRPILDFKGSLQAELSSIRLPDGSSLVCAKAENDGHMVIIRRSTSGEVFWMDKLIPTKNEAGKTKEGRINDLRFVRLENIESGTNVVVSVNWFWGGKERGVLKLNHEFRIVEYYLDW